MARTKSTVRVSDIPAIVAASDRGIVSLVGDHGGLSQVVGEVHPSAVVRGTIRVETEHGSIYLDPDIEVEISEHYPDTLTENDLRDTEWHVSWNIDAIDPRTADVVGSTARAAAEMVWRDIFGRDQVTEGDACVFVVTDPADGASVSVDLSESEAGR